MTRDPITCILIASTVTFTVTGQLLFKAGMVEVGELPATVAAAPAFLARAFMNHKVLVGFVFAVLSAVSWLGAISKAELSFVYPFIGLAIVLVPALSGAVFREAVPLTRWVGVAIVCVGLVVASR